MSTQTWSSDFMAVTSEQGSTQSLARVGARRAHATRSAPRKARAASVRGAWTSVAPTETAGHRREEAARLPGSTGGSAQVQSEPADHLVARLFDERGALEPHGRAHEQVPAREQHERAEQGLLESDLIGDGPREDRQEVDEGPEHRVEGAGPVVPHAQAPEVQENPMAGAGRGARLSTDDSSPTVSARGGFSLRHR